jgi:hypothetical protein
MKAQKTIIFAFFLSLLALSYSPSALSYDDGASYSKTIGGMVVGSIQLVDTLPVVGLGIGGGAFFDYRFNDRFSLTVESFFTTQDGTGRSGGEGSIEFLCVPATTFKVYLANANAKIDPYLGIGIGIYYLTEGSVANSTSGLGIGAQIEIGLDYDLANNLMLAVGGTYRSVGLVNGRLDEYKGAIRLTHGSRQCHHLHAVSFIWTNWVSLLG